MKQRTKIILTAIISIVVTFCFTCALFFSLGMGPLFFGKKDANNNSNRPSAKPANSLISEVHAYLNAFYMGEIDEEKLYQYAAKGMAEACGDKYTMYFTPDEFEEYMDTTIGEYVGVGLVLSQTIETNEIIVVLPYEDSPGDEAGILPGDIIFSVDGTTITGDMLDEVADLLRGKELENPEGTNVSLKIKRGDEEPFDVSLTRKKVHLKTVDSKMLEEDIGYTRIISFDSDTDKELAQALDTLKNEGMKKLIIDLRDNGGGDFHASLRAAEKFLDKDSLMVYLQNKHGKREDFYSSGKVYDCEIILLINSNTASASEVLTGALAGNNRVKNIVGTKSFGKGITQNIYPLRSGGGLSITVDKYYTPTGECIHEKGIEPDTVVSLGENDNMLSTMLSYEQDLQLQKAVELFK